MPIAYGTPQALSIQTGAAGTTLASSTTSAAVTGAITTPTTANTVDIHVQMSFGVNAPSVSATTGIYVWAIYSVNNTDWPDAITPGQTTNVTISANGNQLRFLGYVPVTSTGAQTVKSNVFSLAAANGGNLANFAGVVFQNQTGAALTAASGVWESVSY